MPKILADISPLLEETCVAYYWIGFLLADGSFNKLDRLRFRIKDSDHLKLFGKFINYKGKEKEGVSCMDHLLVPKLVEKFKISHVKTYVPCSLDWIKDTDLLISLIVGFIDGDGCINSLKRGDYQINIKCHSSWLNNLTFIGLIVSRLAGTPEIEAQISRGYALLSICNFQTIKFLKNKVKELSLPVLLRKWNRIDCTHSNRIEKAQKNLELAKELLAQGFAKWEICEKLGIRQSTLSAMFKRKGVVTYKGRRTKTCSFL